MAIAHDADATSITSGFNPTQTKTWSHTVAAGANRLMVLSADIWQDVPGTGTITAASYNGVAMSLFIASSGQGSMTSSIWYLVAPATGTNTMSATCTGNTDALKLCSSSFTGVLQSGAADAFNSGVTGSSGNPNTFCDINAANGLICATLSRFSTGAATTNRTAAYNDATGSILGAASWQLGTIVNAYSDTYTGAVNQDWAMCSASFFADVPAVTNAGNFLAFM